MQSTSNSVDRAGWGAATTRTGAVALLAALLALPISGHATLLNPAFEDGFDGWTAEKFDGVDIVPAEVVDDHFTRPGGGLAKLSNSFDFFELALFQSFVLPAGAATLSFDFDWMITSADDDIVQVTLLDDTGGFLLDLFAATGVNVLQRAASGRAMADVTAFAGDSVILEFLLQDGDFIEEDMFSIGNIEIGLAQVTVPAPASGLLLLLAIGALALGRRARRAVHIR